MFGLFVFFNQKCTLIPDTAFCLAQHKAAGRTTITREGHKRTICFRKHPRLPCGSIVGVTGSTLCCSTGLDVCEGDVEACCCCESVVGGGHDSLTTRDVGLSLLSCASREAYDVPEKQIYKSSVTK